MSARQMTPEPNNPEPDPTLIAAELLASLKELLQAIHGPMSELQPAITVAQAVVTKVEGQV